MGVCRGWNGFQQTSLEAGRPSRSIQTLLEVELTPPAPGRVLANQSIAPPTEVGSGVPLRSRQSPRGATWGLGGTVQRQRVSFLPDFTLGGRGLNCWCQLTTMWRLKPEQRSILCREYRAQEARGSSSNSCSNTNLLSHFE